MTDMKKMEAIGKHMCYTKKMPILKMKAYKKKMEDDMTN
jgi:hypothetical protein